MKKSMFLSGIIYLHLKPWTLIPLKLKPVWIPVLSLSYHLIWITLPRWHSHFLIGDVLTSISEKDVIDIATKNLNMWQHVRQLRQHFWTQRLSQPTSSQQVIHEGIPHHRQRGSCTILLASRTDYCITSWWQPSYTDGDSKNNQWRI